jgi:hypothetical protein
MSLYARANLFVGKYKVPSDGHIRLGSGARVRYLRGREGADGWMQDAAGPVWLIVEDGDFWPVMIRIESGRDERQP